MRNVIFKRTTSSDRTKHLLSLWGYTISQADRKEACGLKYLSIRKNYDSKTGKYTIEYKLIADLLIARRKKVFKMEFLYFFVYEVNYGALLWEKYSSA